jgi:SynChlorMet cassette protein ScmC
MRVWWEAALERSVVEVDTGLMAHPEIRVIAMWTVLRLLQFHAISSGGGPFHAMLARLGDHGILIAAAGGTGKSTCYRRLPAPWQGLCDDYALVLRRGSGDYVAHPFPTFSECLNGASARAWHATDVARVDAVFFLEQSSADRVERLASHEAATRVFDAQQQLMATLWPRLDDKVVQDLRTRLLENACTLAASIPSYRLKATLNGRFWEAIEEALPTDMEASAVGRPPCVDSG